MGPPAMGPPLGMAPPPGVGHLSAPHMMPTPPYASPYRHLPPHMHERERDRDRDRERDRDRDRLREREERDRRERDRREEMVIFFLLF